MREELLHILKDEAAGSGNAIRARMLAERLGTTERMVREMIRELIAGGHPVASSVHPPYGFFLVETREEREAYDAQLVSRICELNKRLQDFREMDRGQMKMF